MGVYGTYIQVSSKQNFIQNTTDSNGSIFECSQWLKGNIGANLYFTGGRRGLNQAIVTAQLNTTWVGVDKVISWTTPPLIFGMQPYFDPTR